LNFLERIPKNNGAVRAELFHEEERKVPEVMLCRSIYLLTFRRSVVLTSAE